MGICYSSGDSTQAMSLKSSHKGNLRWMIEMYSSWWRVYDEVQKDKKRPETQSWDLLKLGGQGEVELARTLAR